MKREYAYPEYRIDLPSGMMQQCVDMAARLLKEVGLDVGNGRFLSHLEGKAGIRIDGTRVRFDEDLTRKYIQRFIADKTAAMDKIAASTEPPDDWVVRTAGFSMMIIDVESERLREATCRDLREMIKLASSFGVGGAYMVMPQDVPPIMRALACFKICFETSPDIMPYDYQQPEQLPFLHAMHEVMGRPMDITITIPSACRVDPKDLDIFLDYYPVWKEHRNINFVVLDYPMSGISKPISVTGCAAMCFAETLAVHILFNLFDPDLKLGVNLAGGLPTDMRNACWAFGSPRRHLFRHLGAMLWPNLCGQPPTSYAVKETVLLETSSPAIDEQAAMEKMATGMMGAMQGARHFDYAGALCVDDVYSGTQFVIDLEIVDYIRQTIEAFDPHPDVIDIAGLYEECKDVALGGETFLSHVNTARKCRNILPSSDMLVRRKLRSWMTDCRLVKDRAREVALDRIRSFDPPGLPDDKQRELEKIYKRAEAVLSS